MSNSSQRKLLKVIDGKIANPVFNRYWLLLLGLTWASTISIGAMSFNNLCSPGKEIPKESWQSGNDRGKIISTQDQQINFLFFLDLLLILSCTASPWLFGYWRSKKALVSIKPTNPVDWKSQEKPNHSHLSKMSPAMVSSFPEFNSPTPDISTLQSLSSQKKSVSYRITKAKLSSDIRHPLAKVQLPFEQVRIQK